MNKSMDMSAENVIENWANYVNQSDLPGLMGLYAKDATLVPTFSRKILHTPEKIEQYFFRFLHLALGIHTFLYQVQTPYK